jgi:hypothetical protein
MVDREIDKRITNRPIGRDIDSISKCSGVTNSAPPYH